MILGLHAMIYRDYFHFIYVACNITLRRLSQQDIQRATSGIDINIREKYEYLNKPKGKSIEMNKTNLKPIFRRDSYFSFVFDE